MNPITINSNQNFCARIKINKDVKMDIANSSALSSMGAASSGFGVFSIIPAFDPAHHIHPAAKSVDLVSSLSGLGLIGYGTYYFKKAASFLAKPFKNINISNK